MFDIVRENPSAAHPPLEAWIQKDLAERIFAASGLDFQTMRAAARKKDFKPVPLNAQLSLKGAADAQVINSHNVVGYLPGTKYPDETVIYSAHWDHLGIGKPDDKGDTIYNGGLDNATGTSQLIEQARAFAHAAQAAACAAADGVVPPTTELRAVPNGAALSVSGPLGKTPNSCA